jgi:hypothetical protein
MGWLEGAVALRGREKRGVVIISRDIAVRGNLEKRENR